MSDEATDRRCRPAPMVFGRLVTVRDWLVGGAVIESASIAGASGDAGDPAAVLLVENRRRGGLVDWTPPGGVIDEGEDLVFGLTREVREETGLEVVTWSGPVYEIVAEAPGLGWRLRVEVHRAVEVTGELAVGADPDGIVVGAAWVDATTCGERLVDAHPWVREPLLEWLVDREAVLDPFRYEILGERQTELAVNRLRGG